MAIRLGSSCANCDNMMSDNICRVHGVKVGAHYTCDHFEMKTELADHRDCTSCQRYERDDCANPAKAAPGMMCSVWAPQEFRA